MNVIVILAIALGLSVAACSTKDPSMGSGAKGGGLGASAGGRTGSGGVPGTAGNAGSAGGVVQDVTMPASNPVSATSAAAARSWTVSRRAGGGGSSPAPSAAFPRVELTGRPPRRPWWDRQYYQK